MKHEWKVLKDDIYPSKLDEYNRITGNKIAPKSIEGLERLTERTVIIIMSCEKCGKLVIKRYEI
jgi:hypothetical protein